MFDYLCQIYYNHVMEMISKNSYIGTKFLVDNTKNLKNTLLARKGVFSSLISSFYKKDSIVKTYFDTNSGYFTGQGISINITRYNHSAELVVRYSSSTPRIAFLNSLPDTFTKQIDRKDYVEEHFEFITSAVKELIPSGLSQIEKMVKEIKPQVSVCKKRERYKLFNNNGLKFILSIDEAEYSTFYNRMKQKLSMCETILLSDTKTAREFYNFEHALSMQIPPIIKLAQNDYNIAQTYLGSRK